MHPKGLAFSNKQHQIVPESVAEMFPTKAFTETRAVIEEMVVEQETDTQFWTNL